MIGTRLQKRVENCDHRLWYYYHEADRYECVGCGLREESAVHLKRFMRKPEPVVERVDGLPSRRYGKEQ